MEADGDGVEALKRGGPVPLAGGRTPGYTTSLSDGGTCVRPTLLHLAPPRRSSESPEAAPGQAADSRQGFRDVSLNALWAGKRPSSPFLVRGGSAEMRTVYPIL